MRASYEEKTGSQRELGLDQGAFNEDLLAKMQKNNMTIDFTTGTLDFNGFDDFKDKATAAFFKMSSATFIFDASIAICSTASRLYPSFARAIAACRLIFFETLLQNIVSLDNFILIETDFTKCSF